MIPAPFGFLSTSNSGTLIAFDEAVGVAWDVYGGVIDPEYQNITEAVGVNWDVFGSIQPATASTQNAGFIYTVSGSVV